jgi:hypothetical protein
MSINSGNNRSTIPSKHTEIISKSSVSASGTEPFSCPQVGAQAWLSIAG